MEEDQIRRLAGDLEKACNDTLQKYDINSGGCCYVAAIIAEGLYKLKIPYKLIIACDNIIGPRLQIRKKIKNRTLSTRSHYFIYLHNQKIYINSGGCTKIWYYKLNEVGKISPTDLMDYYKSKRWNTYYRKANNKIVASELRKIFKNYEKGT